MAKQKWINVYKVLPNGRCIAVNKYGYVCIGHITSSLNGYCCEDFCGETIFDITHWMPLPEPPKEET